jgi:hypothetical protein
LGDEEKNFKDWYVDVLELLYPNHNAGIAVFMISLPLLERYLRQKNGRAPADGLNDACHSDLRVIFPSLPNVATARQFWSVYRDGFLHQATLSLHTRSGAGLPVGWLSHDIAIAIELRADGSFVVQPELFSKQVIRTIQSNFGVFASVGAGAPPLPVVQKIDPITIPSTHIGTRGGGP